MWLIKNYTRQFGFTQGLSGLNTAKVMIYF